MFVSEASWRESWQARAGLATYGCVLLALWATFLSAKSTILLNYTCLSFELRNISEHKLYDFMANIVIDIC